MQSTFVAGFWGNIQSMKNTFESIHLIDWQPVTCISLQVIENLYGRSSIFPSSL
ncbi:hypothetical protein C802_03817 [Phocaeicola sartorii]|uniref:Uncharacterized protein n=1 Tax=Phocaeicola sartorii TaxID=671267 RepID=R9HZW0_9BACT|nr:hypothetical protein C802_03817 [Phocaeicola sartorii]